MHKFLFYNKCIILHVSGTILLVIRRSKFYYTACGIITPVGGRPVHLCTGSPPTECDDTRCCIIQFLTPDDEHSNARYM